jgi:HSP20 family protein
MANESKQQTTASAKGQEIQKAAPAKVMGPFEEMERMFENFFSPGWMRPLHWPRSLLGEMAAPFSGAMPRVDVIDRDDEVVVRAEIPGVEKRDLDVSMTGNTATVKGSTRHEEKEEKGNYYRCEISHGAFSRTVALPAEVDDSKAKAVFKDGLLELTIPKKEKSKRHSISIQ